ncbi:Tat protein secretion system quality control protein TatD with DNase activity [Bacillus tianshenii]|uniref:Tat protein secretion system quality control protein TatD with DNase activity n=1 Tax=Sutcliffiella tianshenii TaxID=1463404 RepID=A0ABS2NVQ9_9BACI|nr:general stress protein [Bacillus tianshenii]MBM7618751.1 Tat protein secretion system quality control protein TatD with DNase activity [Bacillus tianshenii]
MKPTYKEFQNDEQVVGAVQELKAQGVHENDIYVITHDDDRTKRVADNADANTVGVGDVGLDTYVKNVFRSKGDELRAQFQELGFTSGEAEQLEEKLDHGKVILVVKDATASSTF